MAIVITAVLLLCYLIGFWVLTLGIEQCRLGWAARRWPTVLARLEECGVAQRSAKGGTNTTMYQATVKYSYAAGKEQYVGETVKFDYWWSSCNRSHDRLCRRMREMAPFVIRHHPAQPELSTVFPVEGLFFPMTLFFSVFWLGMTTLFALIALAVSGYGRMMLGWFG